MKHKLISATLLLTACLVTITCKQGEKSEFKSTVVHEEWTRDAVIYEVNIRQYSPEGTFKAFENDLPRLAELGVDILWLMPIHPIGIKNRKGELGSYYAVKDYKDVNQEFGTMDDFKELVKSIHNLGMKIIIDWVPNHSAWDNLLVDEQPHFYMRDSLDGLISPFDWTDVVRFDYNNTAMRHYMIETMQWWLRETTIDGYRCDVAHMVPVSFWDELRPELEKIKPVFLLAEADQPELHINAFHMSYDWKLHHIFNEIGAGRYKPSTITRHLEWVSTAYPPDAYLMQFTSNHDENSWNGTEFERYGEGALTFAVLSATLPDMLLIYNGQESAFNRRLKFFEKDIIDWGNYSLTGFYQQLIGLKKANRALLNGLAGGKVVVHSSESDTCTFAFSRNSHNHNILVICNLCNNETSFTYTNPVENLKELFTGLVMGRKDTTILLAPWQYLVYSDVPVKP